MSILCCLHTFLQFLSWFLHLHIRCMYEKCKFLRWNLCCTKIDAASNRCDSPKNLSALPEWSHIMSSVVIQTSIWTSRPSIINLEKISRRIATDCQLLFAHACIIIQLVCLLLTAVVFWLTYLEHHFFIRHLLTRKSSVHLSLWPNFLDPLCGRILIMCSTLWIGVWFELSILVVSWASCGSTWAASARCVATCQPLRLKFAVRAVEKDTIRIIGPPMRC